MPISTDEFFWWRFVRKLFRMGYGSLLECEQIPLVDAAIYLCLESDIDAFMEKNFKKKK